MPGLRTTPTRYVPIQESTPGPSLSTLIDVNPDSRCFTCVGYAPSKGRRCHNPININNRSFARSLLSKGTMMLHSGEDLQDLLHTLASRVLCKRYHQNQAQNMVEQWNRDVDLFDCLSQFDTEEPRFGYPSAEPGVLARGGPPSYPRTTNVVAPPNQYITPSPSPSRTRTAVSPPRRTTNAAPPPAQFITPPPSPSRNRAATSSQPISPRNVTTSPSERSGPPSPPRRTTNTVPPPTQYPTPSPSPSRSRTTTPSPPRNIPTHHTDPFRPRTSSNISPFYHPGVTSLINTPPHPPTSPQSRRSGSAVPAPTSPPSTRGRVTTRPPNAGRLLPWEPGSETEPIPILRRNSQPRPPSESEGGSERASSPPITETRASPPPEPSTTTRRERGTRKPIHPNENCSICYDPLLPANSTDDDELVWCKSQCGTNYHRDCFEEWRESGGGTCPYWYVFVFFLLFEREG